SRTARSQYAVRHSLFTGVHVQQDKPSNVFRFDRIGDRTETHWSRILHCDLLGSTVTLWTVDARHISGTGRRATAVGRVIDGVHPPVRQPQRARNTRNKIGTPLKLPHYIRLVDSSLPDEQGVHDSSEETSVAQEDPSFIDRIRSPIAAAAILLGIYV